MQKNSTEHMLFLNQVGEMADILFDLKPATKLRFPNTIETANKLLTEAITSLVMEPDDTSLKLAKENLTSIEYLLMHVY